MSAAPNDVIFLTGATGFVGGHVLRALLDAGYTVKALARAPNDAIEPDERCELVCGELRRAGELIESLRGCRYLVHCAALYTFAPSRRGEVWQTNVAGTAGLLEAAVLAGVERAVVTSSSATVGPARDGRPATEDDHADLHDEISVYHHSKVEQERVALKARLPVVLVLPTTPIGPRDRKPTPTGKMIVDFMRGKIFASLPGGMNVVPVEDVARAHVAALERGVPGERYLIGGDNLSLSQLWTMLAAICGRPAPTREIPYRLATIFGWADEFRCRAFRDEQPLAPLEGVRMARFNMFVDASKARNELGIYPTPVPEALQRAVQWFHEHGYA
jgi:dihydroflavonol-4-reductase